MSKPSLGQRERTLLITLAILLPLLAWQYFGDFLGGNAGGIGGGGSTQRQSRSFDGVTVVEPRLAALEAERAEYEPGRNIFRFAPKAPPPPPPRPTPPPTPPPTPTDRTPPPPPPPVGPKPPPLDLEPLGIFGPKSRRVAVLRDGELLINALEGDVIDGKFVVEAIDIESVVFKFVGFPEVEPERVMIGE